MTTYTITFELVTGTKVSIQLQLSSTRELYEVLNTEDQWVGTPYKQINMRHVTHYVID
ncbi:hypothetical protein [Bacillus altitudinis]|uniref:hypothetical protein n=1 Tax=Bacillus altitudinis TaxID=293387 RepID=UPI000AF9C54E|nr:hypothetical protein [Bacillus altitudinis]